MNTENEFPKTLLYMRTVLGDLEFNSNILNYELDYIKTATDSNATNNRNVLNIRVFKHRILPAIERIGRAFYRLERAKARALHQMADLQGKGRG